jgi:hypothetical protein
MLTVPTKNGKKIEQAVSLSPMRNRLAVSRQKYCGSSGTTSTPPVRVTRVSLLLMLVIHS